MNETPQTVQLASIVVESAVYLVILVVVLLVLALTPGKSLSDRLTKEGKAELYDYCCNIINVFVIEVGLK